MKECEDGVLVSPSTSCPFAKNVRDAYFAVPGDSVEIDVHSPVTGRRMRWPASRPATASRAAAETKRW